MAVAIDERMQAIGTVFRGIRLACISSFAIDDDVCAYVCGIRIGESRLEGRFQSGDVIEFPIDYLPWIELPADIHIVNLRTGADLCAPFPLTSHEQAITLVGIGDITIENLAIEQGMMRGMAINRINGLIRPQMFARINGIVPRVISVEPPRLIDDGGASFQFACTLQPADLGENGMTVEVFLVGKDAPLAAIAYSRSDVDDLSKRIVELEAQLAQIKTSTAFKFSTVNSDIAARMDAIQQRIDTFIEYSSSFMFDRVAATDTATQPGVEAMAQERRAKVEAFLDIVRNGAGQAKAETVLPDHSSIVTLPLRASEFSYGWYDVEEEDSVNFRWMAADAIIFNPMPQRPLREVRIALMSVFGAERPMLRASFDTVPARINVSAPSGPKRPGWLLHIAPNERGKATTCQALNLASLLASSPAHTAGSNDSRMLSISVTNVAFEYAD